jgi:hypothetical protein
MAPDNPIMHSSDGVSIRDYVDLRFVEAQRGIDKAEATMSARLATMNEFRDQLKDQAGKFITRDELTSLMNQIDGDIKALQKITDRAEGKASQNSVLFAALVSVVGLILGLINMFGK